MPLEVAVNNPYYDPQMLHEWRSRISRLRVLSDMPAPWEVDSDIDRWRAGLGKDDRLSQHMLEWKLWLLSLSPEFRTSYRTCRPEPPEWQGFYGFVFDRFPKHQNVPEDQGPGVYWDALEKHYESVLGVA